jgi:hypothetical protein
MPRYTQTTKTSLPSTSRAACRTDPQTEASRESFVTPRWDGWASFHRLNVQASHRFSHGLQFDASDMWSHSIDDASDAGSTNAEFNLPQED